MRGISCTSSTLQLVTVSSERKAAADDKLCSPPQCESHCGFQFSEHQLVPSQACFKHYTLQRSYVVLLPPPSCHSLLKNSMKYTLVIDKPVGKWLWKDSWLNVEYLFCFLLCVCRPTYFFNCWPCKNCWLLPGASVVRVTADCISSAESRLSMDATLSAAGTQQTTH